MTEDMKNLMSQIEKFIKGGRIVIELLTKEEAEDLTPRQICVEFDYEEKVARLFIMNDQGEIVPVKSKAEDLIEEFLIKFIEVGVNKKYDYDPSLHFKLMHDTEGFTQANIERFYNYMTENFTQFKPYIQYVKDFDSNTHGVIPFMSSDAVYLNLGRIIQDKGITNVTTAINELYEFMTSYRTSMESIINKMNNSLNGLIESIKDDLKLLSDKYGDQTNLVESINQKIKELENTVNGVDVNYEKAYRMTEFNVVNGLRKIAITFGKETGLVISGSVKAKVSSPIIVIITNSSGTRCVLELGQNGYITDMSGNADEYVVRLDYKGGTKLLKAVEPISNGFNVSIQGAVKIQVLSRKNDISIRDVGTGSDLVNTVPAWNESGVYRFSKATLVTNNFIFGNYKFSIQ